MPTSLPPNSVHLRNGLQIGNVLIDEVTGDIFTTGEIHAVNAGDTSGIVWEMKTASYDARRFYHYYNAMNQPFNATLPENPVVGDWLVFKVDHQSAANPLRIIGNGELIVGVAEDLYVNANNVEFTIIYTGASHGWVI